MIRVKQEPCQIVQDQDCHWYLVPQSQVKLFHELAEREDGWADERWIPFESMAIDSPESIMIHSYEFK